ncbi:DUF3515 domain-containing protein [Amycolatopsis rhizosphaerae]|uniref:DUF3515 domain-containing protein n=1 Tax=Amycolatopsis rhizosphaerae TaxID=2053003 RepID=A0A558B8F1_9PSEU|nr:DUF3515 domain-containing protein [Amycolatopsis rhizosphaerae]TVT32791.1 DUF3515 domain-containing protein [Amycolatopsis rhizosphaerae]
MPDTETTGAPSRRLIVLASVLALALAAGVAIAGVLGSRSGPSGDGPLALVPVPAPQANSPECDRILAALPAELTSDGTKLSRRELAQPAPPATVAWGSPEAVVVRCGLERPGDLTPSSSLRVVSGVQTLLAEGDGSSTWYVVDRAVYLGVTVPSSAGTGPLQQVLETVANTLPAVPLRF